MNEKFSVQIALDVPLSTTFTYLSDSPLTPGTRVKVPFRQGHKCGVVMDVEPSGEMDVAKIKTIIHCFDEILPLPQSFLKLVQFCAAYYHYPIGQTLFAALPAPLRRPDPVKVKDERAWVASLSVDQQPISPRQKKRLELWKKLQAGPLDSQTIRQFYPQGLKWCQEWLSAGWVNRIAIEQSPVIVPGPELLPEQAIALSRIVLNTYKPYLLHGVTGSGKTEIYLRLIAQALAQGQQALVLVPEISLTPQLVQRFQARFPQTVLSVLHSNIADGERFQAWKRAWDGTASIVIGTRLAVFTPLPKLGVIIVDEEHDLSFKQQDELRYHARDVAIWRAREADVPVVLGSATPSLESLTKARNGSYEWLTLPHRAVTGSTLPTVCLVDTRRKKLQEGLTDNVIEALQYNLAHQKQSLVYINRRGYAPVLSCPACGWLSGCPHCSARLVFHLPHKTLCCHFCGYETKVPLVCPDCGNPDLQPLGQGSQRIEQALTELLPGARLARVDRDTMSNKGAWEAIYQGIQTRSIDILIGTQMLSKGHDFPEVSLVIILNADGGLYSADFRASERLFAQLTQVSGRAGRGETPGKVLIQTQYPEHPLYQHLQRHDYQGYLQQILQEREDAGLPPAAFQALLRADAPALDESLAFLTDARQLVELPAGLGLYGPAPALMVRLSRRERAHLVIESAKRQVLHQFLTAWLPELNRLQRTHRTVRWSVDIDPQEF